MDVRVYRDVAVSYVWEVKVKTAKDFFLALRKREQNIIAVGGAIKVALIWELSLRIGIFLYPFIGFAAACIYGIDSGLRGCGDVNLSSDAGKILIFILLLSVGMNLGLLHFICMRRVTTKKMGGKIRRVYLRKR